LTPAAAIRYASPSKGDIYMSGTIRTYQKCPRCGASFPASKGGFPIICQAGCQTQPTKYFIHVFWRGKPEFIYFDRDGRTIHDWGHAVSVIGEIRGRMASHKTGKGFFDPQAYKRQSATSFKSFWDRFLKKYADKPATAEKIKAIGAYHLAHFHDFQMRDITSWHVDEWWQGLKDKGLSERYMADILTWTKSFFKEALVLEIIEKIPSKLQQLTVKISAPEVDEWLSESEQVLLLGNIPAHDRPIFDFLFLTGVRVNEACGLQRSDIDWRAGVVTVQSTVKRDGSLGQTKNKKKRRIPLAAVRDCFSPAVVSLTGYAFINAQGNRYSDDYVRDTFNRACDAAGIKRIKLKNATRHSFGMGLISKGYDAWQISKIMGHSDVKITEHYIKMVDEKISGAYGRRIETVFGSKKDGRK
jgi:integrase